MEDAFLLSHLRTMAHHSDVSVRSDTLEKIVELN